VYVRYGCKSRQRGSPKKNKIKNPTVVAELALSISPGALDTRLLLHYYGGLVLLIYAPVFSSCLVMNPYPLKVAYALIF